MTDEWIKHNLRSEFGRSKADDILIQGYESIIIGISKNNKPIIYTLDKFAKKSNKKFILL